MKRNYYQKWILTAVLIIASIAFFGYRQHLNTRNEDVPCSEMCKEKDERKTQSEMPIWESLSRQLIALNQ